MKIAKRLANLLYRYCYLFLRKEKEMNTETEHLEYQLISWIIMLNDTNLLMELSKILQKAQAQDQ